jgi:hypothetical protein
MLAAAAAGDGKLGTPHFIMLDAAAAAGDDAQMMASSPKAFAKDPRSSGAASAVQ